MYPMWIMCNEVCPTKAINSLVVPKKAVIVKKNVWDVQYVLRTVLYGAIEGA